MITANSPGWKPSAFKPEAALRTSDLYSDHVRVCQAPAASFHLCAGASGISRQVSSKFVRTVLPRAASSIAARSALMSLATLGNTLLAGGGASLIYVRSRRSIVTLAVAALVCALAFGAMAVVAFGLSNEAVAGSAFVVGAAGAAGLAGWAGLKLRSWPPAR